MKIFKRRNYLIACFLTLIFCKCGCPSEYPLYFYNKSNREISARMYTLYPEITEGLFKYTMIIKAFDLDIRVFSYPWRDICEELGVDTVSFFFIDSDTVSQHSWQEIAEKNLILQRYDLSIADVEWLDNKITYPPTPKMSGMKMYPPYEESYKN